MQPVTAEDYRRIAKARLPRFLFEYFDGAAFDELTHKANQTALSGIELREAVLRDVSQIEVAGSIFGQRLTSPAMLGPVGLAGMVARRGEVAAALAAQHYGVPSMLSTTSICPLEEVAAAAGCWFLYILKDRGFLREMIARAIAARCGALVLTVDLPVAGIRWRDQRSGLATTGPIGGLRRMSQIVARPRWAVGDQGHIGSRRREDSATRGRRCGRDIQSRRPAA
jgi:L-lactate dehydrogenase (cytochrome)